MMSIPEYRVAGRLWALAGPPRWQMARGILWRLAQSMCLGLAVATTLHVLPPVLRGDIPSPSMIGGVTALLGLSLGGQLLCGFRASKASWLSSFEIAGALRLAILDRVRQLPVGFHLSRHRADTVGTITNDIQTLETLMSEAMPRLGQILGLPIVLLAWLIATDSMIGAVALLPIVIALPMLARIHRFLAELSLRRNDLQAAAGARMIEYVQGIAVLRAFDRTTAGVRIFGSALNAFDAVSRRMVSRLTAPLVLFAMTIMAGAPLVIAVAASVHATGADARRQMIDMIVILPFLYPPLVALAALTEQMRGGQAALIRLDRILDAPCLSQSPRPKAPNGFDIRFVDVSFGYDPARPVLCNLSFTVAEREFIRIMGRSGCGKSTVLALIARFHDVDAGRVEIGGVDVRDMNEADLDALISFVFQDVHLFAGTIAENIALGNPDATFEDILDAARTAETHDFIMSLPAGYDTIVGEGGATLSGGERQRIGLTRAIMKDTPILLLDEPTSALDPANVTLIDSVLKKLSHRKTIICVTHHDAISAGGSGNQIGLPDPLATARTLADLVTITSAPNDRLHSTI